MKSLIKTGDIIIIAVILIAAAGMLLFRITSNAEVKDLNAQVIYDGKTVRSFDLDKVDKEEIIELNGCHILVDHGGIVFIDADCPDHICVSSGRLAKAGDMAACVPNKIMIRIVGNGEMDAITY